MRYRRRSNRDYDDDDPGSIAETLADVNDRLDDLARQVARIARRRPGDDNDSPTHQERYRIARRPERADTDPARDDTPRPASNWLPAFDAAAAEKSERPRAPVRQRPAPAPPAIVECTQDLSGLEGQLRTITEQISALHQPCQIDDAVLALRSDLSEIGRAVNEAMPRQAIEVLEKEVRTLGERVERSRESGADIAKLAQLERGVAEVRDALHNLKPAEHLVEVNQAVKILAQKIDQVALISQNPAHLQKVDQAIAGLRVIVSHVASNDAVGKLAEEVRGLSSRLEHAIAENNAKAMSSFDSRITALIAGSSAVSPELKSMIKTLGEQINQVQAKAVQPAQGDSPEIKSMIKALGEQINHAQAKAVQPAQGDSPEIKSMIKTLGEQLNQAQARFAQLPPGDSPELKSMIKSLGEQINQAQAHHAQISESDKLALGSIEDRIVKLSGKLDASDAWLGRLGAIERGMAEILIYFEAQRRIKALEVVKGRINGGAAAAAAAPLAAAPTVTAETIEPETPEPEKAEEAEAAAQTPEEPEAPEEYFTPPSPAEPVPLETIVTTAPSPNLAPNVSFTSTIASPLDALNAAAPDVIPEPPHTQVRRPINPNLPPDTPIEPSPDIVPSRASAADRIMASEAALGPAKPAAREVASQFETLIAARRAAFAAGAETANAEATPFKPTLAEGSETTGKQHLSKYLRWVLLAVSAIAIALAAVYVARDMWPTGESSTVAPSRTNAPNAAPDAAKNPPAMPMPAPEAVPESPPADGPANAPSNNSIPNPTPMPAPISPPNGTSGPEPLGDAGRNKTMPEVTGALNPQDPLNRGPAELPAIIGGPTLRAAAVAGNPAAEYEVAVRYAEGRGVTTNVEEASRWLERAARAGFAPAQFRLGGLYDKGGGLKKDRVLARALYTAAAEKGHAKAMHNLAVLYAEGVDGKPNYRLAAQWFRKAADYGVADSQYNLAILYIRGIGVEQNLAESYKWFALAAEQGDQEAARKREEVAERLDEPTLNAAQLAVQTFNVVQQPEIAVGLRAPSGGWDRANADAQPAKPKAKPSGPGGPVPNSLLSPQPL